MCFNYNTQNINKYQTVHDIQLAIAEAKSILDLK